MNTLAHKFDSLYLISFIHRADKPVDLYQYGRKIRFFNPWSGIVIIPQFLKKFILIKCSYLFHAIHHQFRSILFLITNISLHGLSRSPKNRQKVQWEWTFEFSTQKYRYRFFHSGTHFSLHIKTCYSSLFYQILKHLIRYTLISFLIVSLPIPVQASRIDFGFTESKIFKNSFTIYLSFLFPLKITAHKGFLIQYIKFQMFYALFI